MNNWKIYFKNFVWWFCTKIIIEIAGWFEFSQVTCGSFKGTIVVLVSRKFSAWKIFCWWSWWVFLDRGIKLGITVDVTAAARGNLKDVHMQTDTTLPGEKTMVIVNLSAGWTIIFWYKWTTRSWLSRIIFFRIKIVVIFCKPNKNMIIKKIKDTV